MFGARYFGKRYFGGRYFGPTVSAEPIPSPGIPMGSGGGGSSEGYIGGGNQRYKDPDFWADFTADGHVKRFVDDYVAEYEARQEKVEKARREEIEEFSRYAYERLKSLEGEKRSRLLSAYSLSSDETLSREKKLEAFERMPTRTSQLKKVAELLREQALVERDEEDIIELLSMMN